MKRSDAVALQEGDPIDITPPWKGGWSYDAKVLLVTPQGGIFVNERLVPPRWVPYHWAKATGKRVRLTDAEQNIRQAMLEERAQRICERAQENWWKRRTRKSTGAGSSARVSS